MTPKFAQAVDPIFSRTLSILDRIERDDTIDPEEERLHLVALIDKAEALVGRGQEWKLAKYALVSWIDELMLDTEWNGREWWSNNVLEFQLFQTQDCHVQFFVQAQEASALPGRDALEVFYVCVILGFRGLYGDSNVGAGTPESMHLPSSLDKWASQMALSIRLGQHRPVLSAPGPEIYGAPPVHSITNVIWSLMSVLILGTVAAILVVRIL